MRISACVITKNEENNIIKCLNSMKEIVDEMIVVDTGSSDKTVELATSCGAMVYSFEWQNDFAVAKNFAIEKAKEDWIIFLDADEYFSEESILKVRECLLQLKNQAMDAVMCQLINIDIDNNDRVRDTFSAIRIFRNSSDIRYKNPIHEELVHKKNNNLRLAILTDDIKIYHTGYSTSIVEGKLKRNLEIMLTDIKKNGSEEKYYRYLCDCYHGLKDYEQAVKYAKLHIASNKTSLHSESIVYLKMLYAMTQTKIPNETIKNEFENTIKIFPNMPDFYAQYANFLFDQKIYAIAIEYYLKAIEVHKKNTDTQMASSFTGKLSAIYCNLGRLFSLKNENESAMSYFCEALIANKFNAYAFQKFYHSISKYPEVQIIELLNSIYHRTKEDISFVLENLSKTVLSKVYVYYTNILQKDFGVENEGTRPYQLLSLKKYEELYQYSFKNLCEISPSCNLNINGRQTEVEKVMQKENTNDEFCMQQLKFLLRRIENDIDLKKNINSLMLAIKQKQYEYEQILGSIEKDIFKKSEVIAHLITAFYEQGNKADTLNFAEAAYQKYPDDIAVVYIVASILYVLKEKQKALRILNKFPEKDQKIIVLTRKICGGK